MSIDSTEGLRRGTADGFARLEVDAAARRSVNTDRSGFTPPTMPDGVVRAHDIDDVVATMRFATRNRIPVVVRGAGTGLAGGSSARSGEIVLDVSAMNRILRIDQEEQLVVVEPGVLNADVSSAVAEFGLFYAPDPASTAICSIGGNIATNAGGMRCAKYGVTRESVLGLTVVLADGRVLHTGHDTIKGVTGYDLNALFIGSEGTLGVVVEATLRLRPLPVRTTTTAAYFADTESAARAAAAIIAAHLQPSLLELMDGQTLRAVDAARGTDHSRRGNALVLVQTDGYGADLEQAVAIEAIRPFTDAVIVAGDDAEADELLAARRAAIPSLERLGTVMIGDIAVPRKRLAEAVDGLEAIAVTTGVRMFTIAHAGDGNLHPMIVSDPKDPSGTATSKAALRMTFELASRLGGTLTGEHGVGVLKREWLIDELGATSLELHAMIKSAFDPLGILNPGKAI